MTSQDLFSTTAPKAMLNRQKLRLAEEALLQSGRAENALLREPTERVSKLLVTR